MWRFFFFLLPWFAVDAKYVVYYSDQANIKEFEPYDLLVLDSDIHPSLPHLKDRGKTLLGYISLGEVEEYRPYFQAVKSEGILLQENPNWPGSYFVDLRDPRWARRVIEELIPQILAQGFDGIFMDTLDNPEVLEDTHPGIKQAAATLVQMIKEHYPKVPVMMNRAYFLLPEVGGLIEMEMAESLYSKYNFETKNYERTTQEDYKWQMDQLKAARTQHPKLKFYSLDYWDPKDKEGVKKIYEYERSQGFTPYVSILDLNQVVPEP